MGWLVVLVGWLVGWLVWFVGSLVRWLVCLFCLSVGCLVVIQIV